MDNISFNGGIVVDIFRFDHHDVPLFFVVVKLGWWLIDHLVVFTLCPNLLALWNFFVGTGALTIQVQHPWVHVTRLCFWGLVKPHHVQHPCRINLNYHKCIILLWLDFSGDTQVISSSCRWHKIQGIGTMLVVSLGKGCHLDHPHHLHHHMGEIF